MNDQSRGAQIGKAGEEVGVNPCQDMAFSSSAGSTPAHGSLVSRLGGYLAFLFYFVAIVNGFEEEYVEGIFHLVLAHTTKIFMADES